MSFNRKRDRQNRVFKQKIKPEDQRRKTRRLFLVWNLCSITKDLKKKRYKRSVRKKGQREKQNERKGKKKDREENENKVQ